MEYTARAPLLKNSNSLGGAIKPFWHAHAISACGCDQVETLMKHVKFGSDWTRYVWVIAINCAMTRHRNSPCHYGKTVWWKLPIFITQHYRGLAEFLTKFQSNRVNLLGVGHQSVNHVTSCCQQVALWVGVNIDVWMCSGRDYHLAWKVWGRLDNVHWRYDNFLFYGETSKFAASPRSRPSAKTHHFDNFSSQRGLDDRYQMWSCCDESFKTSS